MLRQLIRHGKGMNRGGINFKGMLIDDAHYRADLLQDPHHIGNIADIRYIFNPAHIIRKDCGRQNGNNSIFRPADGNLSTKRTASVNDEFLQSAHSLFTFR